MRPIFIERNSGGKIFSLNLNYFYAFLVKAAFRLKQNRGTTP
jgi:hypothetical protein